MGKVAMPASVKLEEFIVENFRGNDFTNKPANVDKSRSPYAPNMIRESVGKVQKRRGHYTFKQYDECINGRYVLRVAGEEKVIFHVGNKLYVDDECVYEGVADDRGKCVQLGKYAYIFDGVKSLRYNGEDIESLDEIGYVPTIIIARAPTGGGTTLEPINLLQAKRMEKFSGTSGDKVYYLSSTGIDDDEVTVQKLNSDGDLDALIENTNFTVNRTLGTVTFNVAPGVSPSEKDNIYITYGKTVDGYADKINKCSIATIYGINGGRDRIFVSGNDEFCHTDWYSQLDDGTYFADRWYTLLGQEDSPIMGYTIVNDNLATIKKEASDDTNIFLRTGTLIDGVPTFISDGSYQGVGAVSKYCFSDLENEPMFLTLKGDYAITPSDVLGERYAQLRSFYANGKLLKEENLDSAYAITINQFRYIAINDVLYIFDGGQYWAEKNAPFSHRQYEVFYWTNIGANVLWQEDGNLCFGTSDGRIEKFYEDSDISASYYDNDDPVKASWSTAEIYGRGFDKLKTFKRISVLLGAFSDTACEILGACSGQKFILREYDVSARYFTYSNFNYGKFSYSLDTSPRLLSEKIKLKNVVQAQFIFENSRAEPFALYGIVAQYMQKIQGGSI